MKSAKFDHQRTPSLENALELLGGAEGETRVLGGGQSLGPMMNLRLAQPDQLIDLGLVEGLAEIETDSDRVRIGARVTHARIEDGEIPGVTGAYMQFVASGISYRSVRNRGTIGGSIAHADPAADWPSALLALGGEVIVATQNGNKNLSLDGFQTGPFATGLGYDEILVGFDLPALLDDTKTGYYKVNRKPGEFADAIGAVIVGPEARAVCGATKSAPFRVSGIEEKLGSGTSQLAVGDVREMIEVHDPGFDDYELQIHAVALSRSIERAFA